MSDNKPNISSNGSNEKFTDKNRAFCDEYLKNDGNGTRAYLAIYKDANYNSARTEAARLLAKVTVKAYLEQQRAEIAKAERIERSFVVKHYMKLIADCSADNDRTNLIKVLDNLSKIGGLYVEKPAINLNTTGEITIDFGGYDPTTNAITASQGGSLNISDVDSTEITDE